MTTAASPAPTPRRRLGLTLRRLAVPALAIPSAMGVATLFSVADGAEHRTAQGVIAALGFALMNVGLSVLDVRRPELHPVVQRVTASFIPVLGGTPRRWRAAQRRATGARHHPRRSRGPGPPLRQMPERAGRTPRHHPPGAR